MIGSRKEEVSKDRWNRAQKYEWNFWRSLDASEDFEYYQVFAHRLIHKLSPFSRIDKSSRILEIGSGAAGVITFLPGATRIAMDPLEMRFRRIGAFREIRDKHVHYIAGVGESLPFESNFFDLVIMDNVLDHCRLPDEVLQQVNRVMRTDALFFFQQNVYHCWGRYLRWLMETRVLDSGHPHTFGKQELIDRLGDFHFEVLDISSTGYFRTWVNEIRAGTLKEMMKALLFVTRNKTLFICRKRS